MDKALREAIRKTLDDLTAWSDNGTGDEANMDKLPSIDTPKVEKNALKYLASKGYLEEVRLDGPFRLTARGWDYHEQLRCPPMFWFKNNWFPTIVALGTIITSVTAIVT